MSGPASMRELQRVLPGHHSGWLRVAVSATLLAYGAIVLATLLTRDLTGLVSSSALYALPPLSAALLLRKDRPTLAAVLLFGTVAVEVHLAILGSTAGIRSAGSYVLAPLVVGISLLFGAEAGLATLLVLTVSVPGALLLSWAGPGLPARDVTALVTIIVTLWATLGLVYVFQRSLRLALQKVGFNERRATELIEGSPDAMLLLSSEDRLEAVNPAARTLLGLDEEADLHSVETLPLVKSGTELPWRPSHERAETLQVSGSDRHLESLVREVTRKDGTTGYMVVLRDVSDRIEAERRARELRSQLEHAQKMDAIGRLAGGVAHDFNNLLTALMGQAELIMDSSDPEARAMAKEQLQTLDRGATLTQKLLAFARKESNEPRLIELCRVIRDMEPLLRQIVGKKLELKVTLEPPCHVVADPTQVEQVLLNLVANARDATVDGAGDVRLRCFASQDQAHLEVEDRGTGMPKDVQRRIFEPFFTTKARGKGTGLGLSTVHGIVAGSDGRMEVDSEPGRGTLMRVLWPLHPEPETEEEEEVVYADGADTLPDGVESELPRSRVLLVDDMPDTRRIVHRYLERAGYDVLEAGSGPEALRLLSDAPEPARPWLLLTDVIMPEMTGVELSKRAREFHPGLKVLYMSGFGDDVLSLDEGGLVRDLIPKPFSSAQLRERILEKEEGTRPSG